MLEHIELLNQQTCDLLAVGRYAEALARAHRSYELAHRHLPQQHPEYATCMHNLGAVLRELADYDAAEPFLRKAVELDRMVLGPRHPDFASSLRNLGQLYRVMGRTRLAEKYLVEAKEARLASLGERHADYAASLNDLGELYFSLSDYLTAEINYRRARTVTESSVGKNTAQYSSILSNLGLLYLRRGEFRAAHGLLQEAVEIDQQVRGAAHPDFGTSLCNLGLLYHLLGDQPLARTFFERALRIRKKALGDCHPDCALALEQLAATCQSEGKYEDALTNYRAALEIYQNPPSQGSTGHVSCLNSLAVAHVMRGEYDAAALVLRSIPERVRSQDPASLHNMGCVCHAKGEFALAESYFRQAISRLEEVVHRRSPDLPRSFCSLAAVRAAQENYDEALDLMQRAFAIEDWSIANVFGFTSERQKLAFLATVRRHFWQFLSLVVGRLSDSQPALDAAFEVVLRRKGIVADALLAHREDILGTRHPYLLAKLQHWRALKAQIAHSFWTHFFVGDPGFQRERVQQWEAEKDALESDLATSVPEIDFERRLQAVSREAMSRYLPRGSALVEFVYFEDFDFDAVPLRGDHQWRPGKYAAFVLTPGNSARVTLVDIGIAEQIDEQIRALRSDRPPSILGRPMVKRLSRLPRASTASPARFLCSAVWDKLVPVLGDAKHILVAADGEINLLPFQVLPRGDEGYLIDERRFTYLSCGRDLARLPGLDGHDGNAGVSSIVVADPDYDALIGHAETPDRGSELADRCRRPLVNVREPLGRLPWSRVEGERIARLLPAAHLWTDAGASKSRLQRDCHSPRVLHLATHGRFVTRSELVSPPIEPFAFSLGHNAMAVPDAYLDNPLTRSGLALAGFNCDHGQGDQWDGIDGGLLTADEVAGLDLRRTELAVVSACDTGIGEVACGEGVFGLRRAFQLAGAKSLVMTLWEVDDLATAILMERFYRCLVPDGCTPSEALCRAQQELRQLTVADLREEWLCARTIHRVSAGNGELTAKLAQLAAADSKVRPFCAPDVWGAYICQTCMP